PGVWIDVVFATGVDERRSRATVSRGRLGLPPSGHRLEQRSRLGVGMPLDAETEELLHAHLGDHEAVRAVLFGRCWADSPWTADLDVELSAGGTLDAATARLDLAWHPQWLLDAGHQALDADGASLSIDTPATRSGPIRWVPEVRLPKVDDQVRDSEAAGSP